MRYSRAQAMRLFCLECMGWNPHREEKPRTGRGEAAFEVKQCTDPDCPLYEYRNKGPIPAQFMSAKRRESAKVRAKTGLFSKGGGL